MRTVFGAHTAAQRPNPGRLVEQPPLTEAASKHSAALMRINHTGEVCAQALYQGQALTAKLSSVRHSMEQAAEEENDHLYWCRERIHELGSHTSYLNPVWYLGSFTIGASAGFIGDKWSLGFVAETEKQVVRHLESHLQQIPAHDYKSREILLQMKDDEQHHATVAMEAGAATLPAPIQFLMKVSAKMMTSTTYWI